MKLTITRPALIEAFEKQGRDITRLHTKRCVHLYVHNATLNTISTKRK